MFEQLDGEIVVTCHLNVDDARLSVLNSQETVPPAIRNLECNFLEPPETQAIFMESEGY